MSAMPRPSSKATAGAQSTHNSSSNCSQGGNRGPSSSSSSSGGGGCSGGASYVRRRGGKSGAVQQPPAQQQQQQQQSPPPQQQSPPPQQQQQAPSGVAGCRGGEEGMADADQGRAPAQAGVPLGTAACRTAGNPRSLASIKEQCALLSPSVLQHQRMQAKLACIFPSFRLPAAQLQSRNLVNSS